MGCGTSVAESTPESKNIDTQLRKDWKDKRNHFTLLVLGAAESGKSTIVKHFQMLNNEFSDDLRRDFKLRIRKFAIDSLKNLLRAMSTSNLEQETVVPIMEYSPFLDELEDVDPNIVKKLIKLWSMPEVQEEWKHRKSGVSSAASAEFFLESMKRIFEKKYSPTNMDCLKVRAQTTGIIEVLIHSTDNVLLKFVDVGGQRNERRKWIHCFENVNMILYVVAMDEYDAKLAEDPSVNRMMESLRLFKALSTTSALNEIPFIIFFNKRDMLKDKLPYSNPSTLFPEYTGEDDFKEAVDFLSQKYLTEIDTTNRKVFSHLTNALDNENIKRVWKDLHEVILQTNLVMSGLA